MEREKGGGGKPSSSKGHRGEKEEKQSSFHDGGGPILPLKRDMTAKEGVLLSLREALPRGKQVQGMQGGGEEEDKIISNPEKFPWRELGKKYWGGRGLS